MYISNVPFKSKLIFLCFYAILGRPNSVLIKDMTNFQIKASFGCVCMCVIGSNLSLNCVKNKDIKILKFLEF